jgi:hypothetical protein
MANIVIAHETDQSKIAMLDDQDEDGLYCWRCTRGHESDRRTSLTDAVNDAEVHIDHQCT